MELEPLLGRGFGDSQASRDTAVGMLQYVVFALFLFAVITRWNAPVVDAPTLYFQDTAHRISVFTRRYWASATRMFFDAPPPPPPPTSAPNNTLPPTKQPHNQPQANAAVAGAAVSGFRRESPSIHDIVPESARPRVDVSVFHIPGLGGDDDFEASKASNSSTLRSLIDTVTDTVVAEDPNMVPSTPSDTNPTQHPTLDTNTSLIAARPPGPQVDLSGHYQPSQPQSELDPQPPLPNAPPRTFD
eukprot:c19053_g1_i1.p1 GENE.c19053_g1_i1~~c19053_g1_i1.p1  ORF type:complete len:244 (+),score=49.55 c19053_g1_i1:65-796(+)